MDLTLPRGRNICPECPGLHHTVHCTVHWVQQPTARHYGRVGNSFFSFFALCSFAQNCSFLRALSSCDCKWFAHDSLFGSQKTSDLLKKIRSFHHVFDGFSLLFPFLFPRVNHSRHSSLRCTFLKSYGSNLLSLLFTKELDWIYRFFTFLWSKDRFDREKDQIAPIDLL